MKVRAIRRIAAVLAALALVAAPAMTGSKAVAQGADLASEVTNPFFAVMCGLGFTGWCVSTEPSLQSQ